MQTFKTYEQLMTHYWGKTVPMAQDAGIDPWECVRVNDHKFKGHPDFDCNPELYIYTFAITILEGKPVFVGDRLYANNCTQPLMIKGNSEQSGYLSVGNCTNYDISILSWTPPIKKRTFMFGDKEFPMFMDKPVNSIHAMDISCRSSGSSPSFHSIYFDTAEEMIEVFNGFREYLIDTARDKE